jgi:glycosyltransferase involved in cell wall biosynthesis
MSNIVLFATMFYGEGRERQQHLADHFQRSGSKVLWVNPMGSVNYSFGNFIKKIIRYFRRGNQVQVPDRPGMAFRTMLFLPGASNKYLQKVNAYLVCWQVRHAFKKNFNSDPDLLWTYYSSALLGLVLPKLQASSQTSVRIVYDNVQRLRGEGLYGEEQLHYEADLVAKTDAIICDSVTIQEDMLREYGKTSYRVPQGVNLNDFSMKEANPEIERRVWAEIGGLPRPIIGYVGGLHHSFDQELVLRVAQNLADASIVIVGAASVDVSILQADNLYLLGSKKYNDLKYYINLFDVCLIPYKINSFTMGVYPTKMLEYLAMKKQVVSTDLPDVRLLIGHLKVAKNPTEFVEMVKNEPMGPVPDEFIAENSWENRFMAIDKIIEAISK